MSERAYVQEDYSSGQPGHLVLRTGDVIDLLEEHTSGYFLAFYAGHEGWVAASSVSRGTPLQPVAEFEPLSDEEVALFPAQLAFGLRQEGDWWYGISGSSVGYFPATFVEPAAAIQLKNSTADPTSASELANKRASWVRKPATPATATVALKDGAGKSAADIAKRASAAPASDGHTYKGMQPLQFSLVAHNMAYGSALFAIVCGIFSILWANAYGYNCDIIGNNHRINEIYIADENGNCEAGGDSRNGDTVCCDPDADPFINVSGSVPVGAIYILIGIAIFPLENVTWGFGLWRPTDTWWFRFSVPLFGMLYIILSLPGWPFFSTQMASGFLAITGIMNAIATYRGEGGDGGREERRKMLLKGQKPKSMMPKPTFMDPITWYRKVRDEDLLSSYAWLGVFFGINILIFAVTLYMYYEIVFDMEEGLEDGSFNLLCNTPQCEENRQVVENGALSRYLPWAKAGGVTLNFDCTVILLPVTRLLLNKLNNLGTSINLGKAEGSAFARVFAHPITRYVPLSKNIEFHKIIAGTVLFLGLEHTVAHLFNYWQCSEYTLVRYAKYGWGGTTIFTGAVISLAMFFIYAAATDQVRHASFEIFFFSHHWFFIFFFFLYLHGPVFFYWATIPVILYLAERYLQLWRGSKPFLVSRVEWIPPVIAVQFRPQNKEDFIFKEGQYLYLNCPYISRSEWHPFTISSASDDLNFGPRIHLETGEEVVEVPRPTDLPVGAKWNKFCLVSKDWRTVPREELLEKHETGYNDYVSVHIKVHGLRDIEARTWTRKLKDYFELMQPGQRFPYYFSRRDNRGEIQIGRLYGPDQKQILRVDGPHSAPSEHYISYKTVMLVGAGIGLTPCASILGALTKFRWKKGFPPELLHFYWVLRHSDVDAFQWFIHELARLQHRLKVDREKGLVPASNYCEINIYITGYKNDRIKTVRPLKAAARNFSEAMSPPSFTAGELYAMMVNPPVDSKNPVEKQRDPNAPNRLQDIFVWNGRPDWMAIFEGVRNQRQHPDIGVCFCGAPVIGRDLRAMCDRFSSKDDNVLFSLHKENF